MNVVIADELIHVSPEILAKYDQPGPRYTSYPTAPEWDDEFGEADLRDAIGKVDGRTDAPPLSLYFHLPFCQSLCLFCGCNVVISKDTAVASPYLERLKREIDWMSQHVSRSRKIEQMHWGGGTPTYLSVDQIEDLFSHIAGKFSLDDNPEIGIEVDPRATSVEQCRSLRKLGFNRLSMGVQDFNPLVQKTIHRVQPYEMTKGLFDQCRDMGFESINIDLIYGLPYQTMESFVDTVDRVVEINPDRIALFSYAHVPWLKKQQGSFASHLPEGIEKFRIFCCATRKLVDAGYRYIGMDHFARPEDELCRAQDDRTLHRNFQGYTTRGGCDLLGMGVSAISGLEDVYAQNWRDLPHYYEAIDRDAWPTMRGANVSTEDKIRRSTINRLLCHCVVVKREVERDFDIDFDDYFAAELERLPDLERDGLIRVEPDRIEVAPLGRIFIRNIAMVFDSYLQNANAQRERRFSRTL